MTEIECGGGAAAEAENEDAVTGTIHAHDVEIGAVDNAFGTKPGRRSQTVEDRTVFEGVADAAIVKCHLLVLIALRHGGIELSLGRDQCVQQGSLRPILLQHVEKLEHVGLGRASQLRLSGCVVGAIDADHDVLGIGAGPGEMPLQQHVDGRQHQKHELPSVEGVG